MAAAVTTPRPIQTLIVTTTTIATVLKRNQTTLATSLVPPNPQARLANFSFNVFPFYPPLPRKRTFFFVTHFLSLLHDVLPENVLKNNLTYVILCGEIDRKGTSVRESKRFVRM